MRPSFVFFFLMHLTLVRMLYIESTAIIGSLLNSSAYTSFPFLTSLLRAQLAVCPDVCIFFSPHAFPNHQHQQALLALPAPPRPVFMQPSRRAHFIHLPLSNSDPPVTNRKYIDISYSHNAECVCIHILCEDRSTIHKCSTWYVFIGLFVSL